MYTWIGLDNGYGTCLTCVILRCPSDVNFTFPFDEVSDCHYLRGDKGPDVSQIELGNFCEWWASGMYDLLPFCGKVQASITAIGDTRVNHLTHTVTKSIKALCIADFHQELDRQRIVIDGELHRNNIVTDGEQLFLSYEIACTQHSDKMFRYFS